MLVIDLIFIVGLVVLELVSVGLEIIILNNDF